ncbi:MAG TPA: TetR/AcrR family transcriptional regulator [Methylovirgula sp.]|nr:TetR/AcrR family transcriptional regulator [Methylovirgula sp.]
MRQNEKVVSRPRGRPPVRCDEDTRRLIVEAAREEFLANGFAGTCMNDVAQRAGVSTKTLYRLIPTKADLFISVISFRIERFMLDTSDDVVGGLDLAEALERILVAYGKLTLDAETIALSRLVIGESDRFPEIAAAFYESAIVRTCRAMQSWLARQSERGLLKLEDARAASSMLRGMMIMEPQRAVMLGQKPAPSAAEIADRAKKVAHLFLEGCRA